MALALTKKTNTERTTASRLRRFIRNGKKITAAERDWLKDYDATKDKTKVPRKHAPRPAEPAEAWAPIADAPELGRDLEPKPAAPEPPELDDDELDDDELDDDELGSAFAAGGASTPAAPAAPSSKAPELPAAPPVPTDGCPLGPHCPECQRARTQLSCTTTGRRVYPPMSDFGANGLAGIILAGMMFGAGVARPDHHRVEPTKWELEETAKAIRTVAYRRAPALGEVDDLLALGWLVANIGARMMREPPPAPKPLPRREDAKPNGAAVEQEGREDGHAAAE
jgi:hypothetical protein